MITTIALIGIILLMLYCAANDRKGKSNLKLWRKSMTDKTGRVVDNACYRLVKGTVKRR